MISNDFYAFKFYAICCEILTIKFGKFDFVVR